MNKHDLVRVFVKGGILSPGDFLKILATAHDLGTDYVHFGSRQDILFPIKDQNRPTLDETFKSINTQYEINEFTHQNVVSSYVSLDVMPNRRWLVPHVYHYILDSLDFKAKYRINLVDPLQSIVPLFTGNINFIASKQENYWYVYVRFNHLGDKPQAYSKMIYGYDLNKAAKLICDLQTSEIESYDQIFEALDKLNLAMQNPLEELQYPEASFPYYEGLNREASGNHWLGLYWRDNKFSINILSELCKRCIETNVGKISLTPWKSLIVKGIDEKHLIGWEKLMGKFGMNLRHSSVELNWHLPMLNEECLSLKNYLVRALDQQDISVSGLNFTIKPNEDMFLFTSVVIEYDEKDCIDGNYTYNILYSKNFNPNLGEYSTYVSGVSKEILPTLLIELSRMYFDQMDEEKLSKEPNQQKNTPTNANLYQCESCLTVYDETYGDSNSDIKAGTQFKDLPNNYSCPTCGNTKESFSQIAI